MLQLFSLAAAICFWSRDLVTSMANSRHQPISLSLCKLLKGHIRATAIPRAAQPRHLSLCSCAHATVVQQCNSLAQKMEQHVQKVSLRLPVHCKWPISLPNKSPLGCWILSQGFDLLHGDCGFGASPSTYGLKHTRSSTCCKLCTCLASTICQNSISKRNEHHVSLPAPLLLSQLAAYAFDSQHIAAAGDSCVGCPGLDYLAAHCIMLCHGTSYYMPPSVLVQYMRANLNASRDGGQRLHWTCCWRRHIRGHQELPTACTCSCIGSLGWQRSCHC